MKTVRHRPLKTVLLFTTLLTLVACIQQGGGTPSPQVGLSIGAPLADQTLAGTVALSAGGIGGSATGLRFTLGSLTAEANTDGTATLDTRTLTDGEYTLTTSASVQGIPVSDSLLVSVVNTLPTSGSVGPSGGTLKSSEDSYATLPPGALDASATLTLEDTTQQQILNDFNVDYTDLKVTFLGALTINATGTTSTGPQLPIQVDLAGWAEGVQVNHQVVMFTLAPDSDGDGIGELMFAANAEATPDGSVITRPTPKTEVYGFTNGNGSLRLQQIKTAQPGELITLQGRGLLPSGALSNTATFTSGEEIIVRPIAIEAGSFNPLLDIQLAVPDLSQGSHSLTLQNLSSGYQSDPITLQVAALGSGTPSTWDDFVTQLRTATQRLTTGNAELTGFATPLVDALEAASDATALAMAASSNLVNASNQSLLDAISDSNYTPEQRTLVAQHALLLDAIAVSVPALAPNAADLAALLLLANPQSAAATLRTQQSGGGCSGGNAGAPIQWGTPTGMGSAPPGGCAGGSAGGGGGGGGSPIRSQRLGSFGPVEGALVRALIPGTGTKRTPFTAITDEAGFYTLQFIPPSEPITLQAIDPQTGKVAEVTTVSGGSLEGITVPLIFTTPPITPGSPIASFTFSDHVEGLVQFDASASSDDGTITEYLWSFGDGEVTSTSSPTIDHTYIEAGDYTVSLVVTDNEGNTGTTQETLTLDQIFNVRIVSRTTSGKLADNGAGRGTSGGALVSPTSNDGRYVAFHAKTEDLTETDQYDGIEAHFFRRDMETGEMVLVDVTAEGQVAFPDISSLDMSSDGRYVAFHNGGSGPDLLPGSAGQVYRKDLDTGELLSTTFPFGGETAVGGLAPTISGDGQLVAQGHSGQLGITLKDFKNGVDIWVTSGFDRGSERPALSADGNYLVFESQAENVVVPDANGTADDIFRYDIADGTIEHVSVTKDGTQADGFSLLARVSSDGRFVSFASHATNLVPGDTNDKEDIFLKDLDTGDVTRISDNTAGEQILFVSSFHWLSPDARYLVLLARYPSDPSEPTGLRPYVKDLATDEMKRIDRNQLGAELVRFSPDPAFIQNLWISSDGRWITYSANTSNLVPGVDAFDDSQVYLLENPLWEPATP